ncbi:MAG: hypothetical protein GY807_16895 [Gammaproteobacteria bacterium]|nr:hypothetical protein [Gammaproteobacteria bacterium]
MKHIFFIVAFLFTSASAYAQEEPNAPCVLDGNQYSHGVIIGKKTCGDGLWRNIEEKPISFCLYAGKLYSDGAVISPGGGPKNDIRCQAGGTWTVRNE